MQNRLSEHFSLAELTFSATALRHGIDNRPGPEVIKNLTLLAENILEPVRQHFAIPFRPSSGYRSPNLNRLLGSAPTSQHITGQAADFEIPGIPNRMLADWIKINLVFDQLILEFHRPDAPHSGWVHCSYLGGSYLGGSYLGGSFLGGSSHKVHNRQQSLIFDGRNHKEF